jgi:flagellar protein FlbT
MKNVMALKITLKPEERLIIGGAVIVNGSTGTHLVVENNVPILRQRDIMSLKDADSPCRRIYFAIQLMYVDEKNLPEHHRIYWELAKDVARAAPSQKGRIAEISDLVLNRQYYQALKLTKKLIAYEQEAINHVRKAD